MGHPDRLLTMFTVIFLLSQNACREISHDLAFIEQFL